MSNPTPSEPLFIHGDDGRWLLADSEEQVHAWIAAYEPDYVAAADGWMHNVGWNRDEYERKRDFVADTGCTSWWEGCLPPADEHPTKKCRRAFRLEYK